ncbi:response regulator transcription factor [Paraburkholderia lacunae]|uniref:Helix-turn-helix transcriptional regulator n=1 Tax=Paraburkholderia lacunae TaxID=2211104 RepID=A0A370NF93_9BURK|nr:response regulator transcription factor [Paraburkholderia lacunae]RDK04260.1 helix-turn-helix transcriptional regulator [Paraburkholderia lacunae]
MNDFSVKTIFANDRPLMVAGMKAVFEKSSVIELIKTCQSPKELIDSIKTQDCDVVLIDYGMRDKGQMAGLTLLSYVRRLRPNLKIVVLLAHENPVIIRSIQARSVSGIVSKFDDVGHIITAIHTGYGGGVYLSPIVRQVIDSAGQERNYRSSKLSPREVEVIRLYLTGMTVGEIAVRLNKGKQTVSAQKTSAMRKLGVKRDMDLMKCAVNMDLIDEAAAVVAMDIA